MEVSHFFYEDYVWTDVLLQSGGFYAILQDYISTSMNRRNQKFVFNYTSGRWQLYSENVNSRRSGEYSLGVKYSLGGFSIGGDGRVLRYGKDFNNSGLFANYTSKAMKVYAEARPLLQTLKLNLSPETDIPLGKVGFMGKGEYSRYSLPLYSEALRYYDAALFFRRNGALNVYLKSGYGGRFYESSPLKNYDKVYASGKVSLNLQGDYISNRGEFALSAESYDYSGLEGTGRRAVKSFLSYTPVFFGFLKMQFSVSRTLDTYFGKLSNQSSAKRDMLVGGELDMGGKSLYMRGRREDYYMLHRERSADSRTLRKYTLGASSSSGSLIWYSEISAIYTFYVFQRENSSLYRYLEISLSHRGDVEAELKVRFWDRGRYSPKNSLYYRSESDVDVYSNGWLPVVRLGWVRIGLSYDIKPTGSAVGVRSVFPGGEVEGMRRREEEREFWEVSFRLSMAL